MQCIRAAAVFVTCLSLSAGQFRFGIKGTQHKATMKISRPPDVLVTAKSLSVSIKEGAAFPDLPAIKLALEQGLQGEFTIASAPADASLTVAVASYLPASTTTVTEQESRSVKVGTEKKVRFGKEVEVDKFENRQVPVEYWKAEGSIALQITLKDKNGTLLDAHSLPFAFSQRKEIAVNGESKISKSTLPSEASILADLIRGVAAKCRERYTKTITPAIALLAVDEELRPGNALAIAGDWSGALASYQAIKLKKNQADRLYNIAVCHEALAFAAYEASGNPDDAEPQFVEALKLYEQAATEDPGEKYFGVAKARLALAKTSFARAKEHAATQQMRAERELADAEAKEKAEAAKREAEAALLAELDSKRPDSADEADFRSIARTRLRATAAEPTAEQQLQLRQLGQSAYKLSEIGAHRVVHQEVANLRVIKVNLDLYRQSFSDMVGTDKTKDAKDKVELQKLAGRLGLSQDDIASVESKFEFKDLSDPPPAAQPPVAPARAPGRPAAPKPAVAKDTTPKAPVPANAKPPANAAIKK